MLFAGNYIDLLPSVYIRDQRLLFDLVLPRRPCSFSSLSTNFIYTYTQWWWLCSPKAGVGGGGGWFINQLMCHFYSTHVLGFCGEADFSRDAHLKILLQKTVLLSTVVSPV